MKVEVYQHDPLLTLVNTPEESMADYGGDQEYYNEMLELYGVEIPDELVYELKSTYKKLIELSQEAERLYQLDRRSKRNPL
jgi:hypothetical protein